MEKNVFGEPIKVCCSSPMTGYFRDGLCRTISTLNKKEKIQEHILYVQ